MEIQDCRWFYCDGGAYESTRHDQKRAQAGDQAVEYAKIWRSAARTIQNQQLMLEENGFGENGADAPRSSEPNQSRYDMYGKQHEIAHSEC